MTRSAPDLILHRGLFTTLHRANPTASRTTDPRLLDFNMFDSAYGPSW